MRAIGGLIAEFGMRRTVGIGPGADSRQRRPDQTAPRRDPTNPEAVPVANPRPSEAAGRFEGGPGRAEGASTTDVSTIGPRLGGAAAWRRHSRRQCLADRGLRHRRLRRLYQPRSPPPSTEFSGLASMSAWQTRLSRQPASSARATRRPTSRRTSTPASRCRTTPTITSRSFARAPTRAASPSWLAAASTSSPNWAPTSRPISRARG